MIWELVLLQTTSTTFLAMFSSEEEGKKNAQLHTYRQGQGSLW